jgi:hypothetical protein
MPYEDGYYFTVENAPRARARYDEWNAWTTQHSLAWDGVGLDIEPEARAMMCLRLAPRDDTARRRPARGKPSSNAERGAVGQRSPLARARQCGRRRMDCAPLAHGETMTMQLPFTREQFFDVFAAYNAALWPGVLALWIASALVAVLLFARPHRASDRIVSTLLAIHWAWSALAYHMAFFTSINPAAWFFAALFLVQAGLFVWWGTIRGTLRFAAESSAWAPVGWVLIAYSLAYPAINAAQHGTFVRIPAFGVPCPTTIFTAGLLMLATPRVWALAIVPIVWSAIGGSAASLLGVRADYALPVAGVALMLSLMFPKGHARLVRKQV